jgi:hypothetical protein
MNSYLAKLVFNIRIDNGNNNKQFDEQTRIIQANTIQAAFLKARTLGKTHEESFVNTENQLVEWKFIDVAELYPLNGARDGEELYSTTHESENAGSFIKHVQDKSMLIQAKSLTFA